MSVRVWNGGDAIRPRVSPRGDYISYEGLAGVRVTQVSTGVETQLSPRGKNPRWLDADTLLWLEPLDSLSAMLVRASFANGNIVVGETGANPAMVGSNIFDAGEGAYASYLNATQRLSVNGLFLRTGCVGMSLAYPWLMTTASGQFDRLNLVTGHHDYYTLPVDHNEFRVSNVNGYMSWGSFGNSWYGAPFQFETQLSFRGLQFGVVRLIYGPNGTPYAFAACCSQSLDQCFVVGWNFANPSGYAILPLPATDPFAVWDGHNFLVTGSDAHGDASLWRVAPVDFTRSLKELTGSTPVPDPVTKPSINVLSYDSRLTSTNIWHAEVVPDPAKPNMKFKVTFEHGNLSFAFTYDNYGPLSDYTGKPRPVQIGG